MSCNDQSVQKVAPFKRGGSFSAHITVFADSGEIQNIQGKTITSDVRSKSGSLVGTMEFAAYDGIIFYGVLTPTNPDTSTWPTGDLFCDLKINNGGVIEYTETFTIPVIDSQTHA